MATMLTYQDDPFDDAMRSLVQHPIGSKHDGDWHGFQLASTDQGLAMIAALGSAQLGLQFGAPTIVLGSA